MDRNSRDRDSSRGGRDEPRRGERDRDGGRDRDDGRGSSDRGGDRGSRRESSSREPSRGGSSRYSYEKRDRASVDKRASMGANDFDKILKDGVKMWTPSKGDNRVRILPPTWAKPEHYGYDIQVHYGVGPDRGTYLDLYKMKGEPDPITEERDALKRSGDATEDELKQMDSKRRVLVYIIDRNNESEGVQAWAMPWTLDKDISVLSVDKSTQAVLNIDDPEEGYDIEFTKEGEKERTKYVGVAIARRSSSLGSGKWLDYAIDNPLPDQLQFFTYDEIAKVFGGAGVQRERSREEPRGGRSHSSDDRTREGGREDSGSDRDRGGRTREASREEPELTYEQIHEMTANELDALVESDDRLRDINPNDATNDAELADWICEDLKLKKAEVSTRRRAEPPAEDEGAARLARMRETRSRR